jgi:trans-aconitate methyltransferase
MSMSAQTWSAAGYAKNARFVADLGAPVLELLAPRAGERILDVGCGDGVLTRKLVELGASVVGVDSSAELVQAALSAGVDARLQSGEELGFVDEFDAVFSNAALHWMTRVDAVIAGVFRALVPGGRFVAEFGGQGCVQTIVRALARSLEERGIDPSSCSPWYFPSAEEYRARLERAGFTVRSAELIDRPTPLPTGVRGWLDTFGHVYLSRVPPEQREAVVGEVEQRVSPLLAGADGVVVADYVRLRVVAEKPNPSPTANRLRSS